MDLHFNGPTHIGEIKDQKGSNITVALPGSVVQQTVPPEDQPQPEAPAPQGENKPRKAPSKEKSTIQLRDFKGKKVNFIRVIKALHKEGFFERISGGTPTEDEVFTAFGIAVNEGLGDYSAQLSANRKDNTPDTRSEIFDTLKDSYKAYEQGIDDKKKESCSD